MQIGIRISNAGHALLGGDVRGAAQRDGVRHARAAAAAEADALLDLKDAGVGARRGGGGGAQREGPVRERAVLPVHEPRPLVRQR